MIAEARLKFSVVICTYMRPNALVALLNSIATQSAYPLEIIIVDGSRDERTKNTLESLSIPALRYFLVAEHERGLTKQRNFGISKVSVESEVVCFLDDDTVLSADFFERLINTYQTHNEALAVGGYVLNENESKLMNKNHLVSRDEFAIDGYVLKESSRYKLRKRLGLDASAPPGFMPEAGHARPISFLPQSGKVYQVELLMGCAFSVRKSVFEALRFSPFFEGYGLYEDAHFCLELAKRGALYVNTAATLWHHHEPSGRPNQFSYGRMMIKNGYAVWHVKFANPSYKSYFKWYATNVLLMLIRLSNTFSGNDKFGALTESFGRFFGLIEVFLTPHKRLLI